MGSYMGVLKKHIQNKKWAYEVKCNWKQSLIYLETGSWESWDVCQEGETGLIFFAEGLEKLELTEASFRHMWRRG